MKIRPNLRLRVIIAFVLLTLFISSSFALGIRYALLFTEEDLLNIYLETEVNDFIELYKHDKNITTRPRSSFTLYIDSQESNGYIPENVLKLNAGFHELLVNNIEYHVFVKNVAQEKLFFVFDNTPFEEHEEFINIALLLGIFFAISASVWIGYFTGNRVISPVTRLANQVSKLLDAESSQFDISSYANDEVGILAIEFEVYINRLQAFLERERNFTADVSHELRTPLMVISGASEVLLAKPDLDEKSRNKLRQINRASSEMAEIITAFLLLAREPSKTNNQNFENCHTNLIVEKQMEQLKYLLANKPVTTELIHENEVYVKSEAQMISIVVGNILRNAYSHTEKGDVKVTLKDHSLTVEDSGPGIKKELRNKIFERSFQINQGETGGTGIGLSIAKRLSDRNAWSIIFSERDGGGTKVTVNFKQT